MKYKQYIYGLLLTVALSACNEYGDLENVMVSRESIRQIFIPALAVTPNTTELEAKGGSLTLAVSSNTAWTGRFQLGVRVVRLLARIMVW